MLQAGRGYLHPAGVPDSRVRDIAVAGDFVRGIYDYHPLFRVVSQYAGYFPEHGRLADAGTPQQQDALARLYQVFNDFDSAKDRPSYPAGQPHDVASPVADSGNTV
jgi:hypothetical protein